jgi:spermidine/putrescine transport system permease protein
MSALETMPVSPLARQTRAILAILAGAILVFLYLPIVFLILFSFEKAASPGFPITGLTTHWYEVMLSDSLIHQALLNSIEVAVAVAILATVIGTTAAFALVRGGSRFAGTGRVLFTLPIMIPGALIGIGLLIFVRRALNLQLGLHTVVMGHLVFCTSFVVLIVTNIILPLIAPAIVAGALLSVTLSIDEFVITFFTIGPQTTLPLYIYTQIKFGVTPEVNALATVMLVVTLAVFAIGSVLLRSGRRLRRRDTA